VPVLWTEKPPKYDDVYGQKTLNATSPVVVLCDTNHGAILYAWTGKASRENLDFRFTVIALRPTLTKTGVAVEKLLPAKFAKMKLRQDAL
jgi:hypothetical protein